MYMYVLRHVRLDHTTAAAAVYKYEVVKYTKYIMIYNAKYEDSTDKSFTKCDERGVFDNHAWMG